MAHADRHGSPDYLRLRAEFKLAEQELERMSFVTFAEHFRHDIKKITAEIRDLEPKPMSRHAR